MRIDPAVRSRWPRIAEGAVDTDAARASMVEHHIAARGIVDERVLAAMSSVRRERFVPKDVAQFAYEDHPLPIGSGQTISQPFIVALMAEAAEIGPDDKVLEIGTGSGYGAAVLARLAASVWTVERLASLTATARDRLASEGIDNVHVVEGDGTLGWPDEAPYDAIIVTAGAPAVPTALQNQLAHGGRLVIPSGSKNRGQTLLRVRRGLGDSGYRSEELGLVRFVPLIGEQGW
jgi:protein-L-isoaspartate(D-aspartate) O-methyltransferase